MKIIVLDDDPTGCQTVHSCLLLTTYDIPTLKLGLTDVRSPELMFILTNTRSMSPNKAEDVTKRVCLNLQAAINEVQLQDENIIIISRSDSTLRGHYPIETNVINDLLGPFDAHFILPAFIEGGRITKDSTHYIIINNDKDEKILQPVHLTEFANDSVFGYSHSYLPKYVEEKTNGDVKASDVQRFILDDITAAKDNVGVSDVISSRLTDLKDNQCCVVDAETYCDLNIFCSKVKQAVSKQNKKFLFRSGASLVSSLATLPSKTQPILAEDMGCYVRDNKPGIILIGSHVSKTTDQLMTMLDLYQNDNKVSFIESIEVNVELIPDDQHKGSNKYLQSIIQEIELAHEEQKSIIIYTTRKEKQCTSQSLRLQFGEQVSSFLMQIVINLPKSIGFLISKGGITTHDVLSTGLGLHTCRVLGQIMAGCSVVCCPDNHERFPNLPIVIFPGNVGDRFGLVTVFERLSGRKNVDEVTSS